jgi:UDP-N-acetylglucosamine 4,6-dehydratase
MRFLIIGGTGTFGKNAAKRLIEEGHHVTIYSRDEQKQEQMREELGGSVGFFLGDVRDKNRLKMAMRGRTHVVHAAALKIVPKGEFDPLEFVETNIRGAANVIEAACEVGGAVHVVFLSTDKAVEPVNLYGTTKKAAEHLFIAANSYAANGWPKFSVVRYGNVWGSRGSVIEVWKRAMERGEKIPITHVEMTRFFMTAPEAVDLVLRAFREMRGGEIFVPVLPAYRVFDLADAFVRVFPESLFAALGIRPGEKLHETLIGEHEAPRAVRTGNTIKILREGKNGGEAPLRSNDVARMSVGELEDWIRKYWDEA